jgi:hypothetical protein
MQPSSSTPFHILGFGENEENIQPLEIAENVSCLTEVIISMLRMSPKTRTLFED